jgi:hypothetical protein
VIDYTVKQWSGSAPVNVQIYTKADVFPWANADIKVQFNPSDYGNSKKAPPPKDDGKTQMPNPEGSTLGEPSGLVDTHSPDQVELRPSESDWRSHIDVTRFAGSLMAHAQSTVNPNPEATGGYGGDIEFPGWGGTCPGSGGQGGGNGNVHPGGNPGIVFGIGPKPKGG